MGLGEVYTRQFFKDSRTGPSRGSNLDRGAFSFLPPPPPPLRTVVVPLLFAADNRLDETTLEYLVALNWQGIRDGQD